MMAEASDGTHRVTQAQFDRLTGANRDEWRKWRRRELAAKSHRGYTWQQVLEALALQAMEEAAGIEAVIHCWDDVRDELLCHIRPHVLDLVIDPGISRASRPRMRAFVSTSDATTAKLARQARSPHVIALAEPLAAARDEFERTVHRASAHADSAAPDEDPGTKRKRSSSAARSARRTRGNDSEAPSGG